MWELVYPRRLEGKRCVPKAPEEAQHGEEPTNMVRVPVGDDDIGDMLPWWPRTGIADATFESVFEEGDVTRPSFAGVDECIGGVLANEIGVCA